jgi:hypothetical protein
MTKTTGPKFLLDQPVKHTRRDLLDAFHEFAAKHGMAAARAVVMHRGYANSSSIMRVDPVAYAGLMEAFAAVDAGTLKLPGYMPDEKPKPKTHGRFWRDGFE